MLFFGVAPLFAQWEHTTLDSVNVVCFAVKGDNLFAGTGDAGVFRSADNGLHWTAVNTGLTNTSVYALAVSGANLFAGTAGDGVFLSTNNGANWTATGLTDGYPFALAVSGANLFAGGWGMGVRLSTDNGTSWTPDLFGHDVLALAVDGANLFAGSADRGVYLSTNDGSTWTDIGLDFAPALAFAVSGPELFTATCDSGVYFSSDHGANWSAIGLKKSCNLTLAASGNDLYAAGIPGSGGIHRTADNGKSWTSTGSLDAFVQALTVDGAYLFAGGDNGVWRLPLSGVIGETTQQYLIGNRWNMLSLPLAVADNHKSVLYPTAVSKAYSYNGGYHMRDTVGNGAGYWLKFDHGQTVSLHGAGIVSYSIDVIEGWNMIGSVSEPIAISAVLSNPGGMATSKFYGYSGGYKTVDTIQPGFGYWVKTGQQGQLILSTVSSVLSRSNRIRIIPDGELPPHSPIVDEVEMARPEEFGLEQNYPKPFNPTTGISYFLPEQSHVHLVIQNILGQEVRTLVNAIVQPGNKSVRFDATGLASGLYFYRLDATSINDPAKSFSQTRKMLLIR